ARVGSPGLFHAPFDGPQRVAAGAGGLEPLHERLTALIEPPLRKAKAARLVRRDLDVGDVFLLIGMVEGALRRGPDPAGRGAAASRVLALALDGLAPRS